MVAFKFFAIIKRIAVSKAYFSFYGLGNDELWYFPLMAFGLNLNANVMAAIYSIISLETCTKSLCTCQGFIYKWIFVWQSQKRVLQCKYNK